jgi:regulator of RNase E activity RraA
MTHPDTLATLKTVSTATLTSLLFKRGFRNVFIQGARPLKPGQRMAGPAYTLRYIPSREDLDGIEAFRDPRHAQRVAVEEIPPGAVLVMDCRGDASVASAGSILATRMQVRGAAGIVSDGGLRDASGIAALDMPAWCSGPSAPTNLIRHHALDINAPIGCGGVPVYPGDIMVGDDDGVVCVPIIGLYPPTAPETRERYAAWLARGAT